MASSTVSSPSGERWCAGIQTMPPDTAVVPPTASAFSYTATDAPPTAAVRAAVKPAPPEPSTTTSTSWSQSVLTGFTFLYVSAEDLRELVGSVDHCVASVDECVLSVGDEVDARRRGGWSASDRHRE